MRQIAFYSAALALVTLISSCVKDEPSKVKPVPVDYTGLVLNEINGSADADADKYIELFNNSTESILLTGVTITYGGVTSWSATKGQTIAPGAYLVLQGTKGTGDLSQGLSAGKNIRVVLLSPGLTEIDVFQRGDGAGGNATGTTGEDYSRVPNGIGTWYFTAASGTKGTTNGTNTGGLTPVNTPV